MRKLTLSIILVLVGCTSNVDVWITPKSTTVSIEDSDLKPSIPKISGKVKFIKDLYSTGKYKLGYKFEVETESLDNKKIPKRYVEEVDTVTWGGSKYTILPIENSSYTSNLIFTLKDKDGFKVNTYVSKDFTIKVNINGKTEMNLIQDDIGELSLEEVNSINKIDVVLHLGECLSCRK
jgi:hypothetical protein